MASELIVQTLKGPTSGANANKVIVPSGQTLTAPGHVIQVVHNLSTSLTSLSTADTWSDASDFSVSITPTSTSSKILIGVKFVYGSSSSTSNSVRLKRNTTPIALGGSSQLNLLGNVFVAHNNAVQGFGTYSIVYEDSPASTDELTYQIQVINSGGTLYINSRNDGNTADCQQHGYISAMEIAG
jgi:hypothetical protein